MKKQRFYPAQVGRRLHRRDVRSMSAGELAAVRFFYMKGRRYGISVAVLNEAEPESLLQATSHGEAARLQQEAPSRFYFNPTPAMFQKAA